jgi:hypothetical protein
MTKRPGGTRRPSQNNGSGKLLGVIVERYEHGVLADILENDTHLIWRQAFADMKTAKTEAMAQARRRLLRIV